MCVLVCAFWIISIYLHDDDTSTLIAFVFLCGLQELSRENRMYGSVWSTVERFMCFAASFGTWWPEKWLVVVMGVEVSCLARFVCLLLGSTRCDFVERHSAEPRDVVGFANRTRLWRRQTFVRSYARGCTLGRVKGVGWIFRKHMAAGKVDGFVVRSSYAC